MYVYIQRQYILCIYIYITILMFYIFFPWVNDKVYVLSNAQLQGLILIEVGWSEIRNISAAIRDFLDLL